MKKSIVPAMLTKVVPIQIHVSDGTGSFKSDEGSPPSLGGSQNQLAAVPARFATIVSSLLSFFPTPAVRQ